MMKKKKQHILNMIWSKLFEQQQQIIAIDSE